MQLEPFSKRLHRQKVNALARLGDRAAALATDDDLKLLLRRHLGASPDVQTRTVHPRMRQGRAREPAPDAGGDRTPPAPVTAGLAPLRSAAHSLLVERDEVRAPLDAALEAGLPVAPGQARRGQDLPAWPMGRGRGSRWPGGHFPAAREESEAAVARSLQEMQPRCAGCPRLPFARPA